MTYTLEMPEKGKPTEKMRLANRETNTYEWGDFGKTAQTSDRVPLTRLEHIALLKAHGAKRLNVERCERVKMLLIKGETGENIYRLLRPFGKGYGKRMIETDCSTLFGSPKK